MMSNWGRLVLVRAGVLILALTAAGCSDTASVSVLFDGDTDIANGTDVVYQDRVIGEVEGVTRDTRGTRLHLVLDRDRLQGLKGGSAAILAERNGEVSVEVFNFRAGKHALMHGDQLVALNNPAEHFVWQTREAVDFGQSKVAALTASVQHFFQSEQWRDQREAFERSLVRLDGHAQGVATEAYEAYDALLQGLLEESRQTGRQIKETYQELLTGLDQCTRQLLRDGERTMANSLRHLLAVLQRIVGKYSESQHRQNSSGSSA